MRISQLAVAMHEAGHAVVQLARPPSPNIRSISIVEQPEGQRGIVDTNLQWQSHMAHAIPVGDAADDWRRFAWEDTIVCLAGPIAENRWRRFSRLAIQLSGDHFAARCIEHESLDPNTDEGKALKRLRWAYPGKERERFTAAWLESEEAVAANWRAIVSIGRLLSQRGRMTGEELQAEWATFA
jgi:hypothetical protein